MNEVVKLGIYFLLGGVLVTLTMHYGDKGNGLMAAFVSQFPSMTVLTFYLIHRSGGNEAVTGYAQGFLYVIPPWILYVLIVYFLCSRIGAFWSLTLGVTVYMVASFLISAAQSAFRS